MSIFKNRLFIRSVQVLLFLLLAVNIYIITTQKSKGIEALEEAPYALLEVDGVSMEPVLHQGDGVFVWQVPYDTLQVGDMVVFYQDGELLTHAIVEINNGELITKGCANDIADPPVAKEDYRAKVLFSVPMLGTLLMFFESPLLLAALVLFLACLLFWPEIVRLVTKQSVRLHITKLLFLALVISSGFLMSFVTRTKYVSYLNDYSHMDAGNTYFTSNYLDTEEAELTYTISNWNPSEYTITMQIRNFENSLLYNPADTDLYYHVEAKMYNDHECTEENENFLYEITYDATETVSYEGKTYALLNGMDTFSRNAGTQNVKVRIRAMAGTVTNSTVYLKLTAATMDLGSLESLPGSNTGGGFYEATREAVFILNNAAHRTDIVTELKVSNTDSVVTYKVICKQIEGSSRVPLRIYYNSDKIEIDQTLGYQVMTNEDPNIAFEKYIETTVNATSITNVIFFKNQMNVEGGIGESDFKTYIQKDGQFEAIT